MPIRQAKITKKMNNTRVINAGHAFVMNDCAPPCSVVTVVAIPPVTSIVGTGVTMPPLVPARPAL